MRNKKSGNIYGGFSHWINLVNKLLLRYIFAQIAKHKNIKP